MEGWEDVRIINDAYEAMAIIGVRLKPNDKDLLDAMLKVAIAVDTLDYLYYRPTTRQMVKQLVSRLRDDARHLVWTIKHRFRPGQQNEIPF